MVKHRTDSADGLRHVSRKQRRIGLCMPPYLTMAFLLLFAQAPEDARADGGRGGRTSGGVGGVDSATGVGGTGNASTFNGGGGGGAGATGGVGGAGIVAGGAGGADAVGGIGGNGAGVASTSANGGGGGGGGGAHGFVGAGSPTLATTGGNGGNGGSATAVNRGGGGGGAGGYGAVVTGGSATIDFAATGGNGGNGGANTSNLLARGGNGGSGGRGALFTGVGSFSVNAAVSGGAGGVRGAGLNLSSSGTHGAGGVGIVATDSVALTLGSGAVVTGGLSGDGVTRASAITLGGAVNRLELRAGASVVGNVFASGTSALALGGTVDGTFDVSTLGPSAQFRGFTSLVKDGTSIWTLTGISSFTGGGTVDAGTLAVDGDVSSFSALTVNAGGVLGGSGTVGATTINGGTLAPGNSIGTLSVAGNLAFTAAATYAVEVSPATADRVTVTGTAVLGGAAVTATFANGSYVARQYTILTATGGVTGTFGTLTNVNLPAAFKTGLSYDPNNAYLDLTLDFTPTPNPALSAPAPSAPTAVSQPASEPVPNRNLNPNQTSAANALTAYFKTNGSIPVAYGTLTPQTLTEAAGEPAATTQQNSFDAMTQFTGAIMPSSLDGRGTPIASAPAGYAAYSSSGGKAVALPRLAADPDAWGWSVWGSGFGARQSHSGQASQGVAASSNSVYGLAAGADYRVSPSTVAGFALAGGATDFSTRGLGTGHSDLAQLGVFIRHHIGQAYVAAATAYGWQAITQDRSVAGIDRLRSEFDVHSLSGRIEGGYRFGAPSLGFTPFAAAQFVVSALPGYSERVMSGPGLFALSYAGRDAVDRRGEIGLRADTTFAVADVAITLTGGLAWAHSFNTGRATATASFQALPGSSFLVSGANRDRNALRSSAGAELKWKNGLALAAAFDGEFTQRSRSYGGKAVLRYTW